MKQQILSITLVPLVLFFAGESRAQTADWALLRAEYRHVGYLFSHFERQGSMLDAARVTHRPVQGIFLLAAFPVAGLRDAGPVDADDFRSERPLGGLVTSVEHEGPWYLTPTESVGIYGRLSDVTVRFRCEAFFDDGTRRDRMCEGSLDVESGAVTFDLNRMLLWRVAELQGESNRECVDEVKKEQVAQHECDGQLFPERVVCHIASRVVAETRCT